MDWDGLNRLIGRIYDAPGDETGWQALLGDFCRAFSADNSHFVVFDRPGHVHFDYITLRAAGQIYADHYAGIDTAMHRVMAGPDRRAVAQLDVMSEEELRVCPMQQEMLPAFGAEHRLWVKSGLGPGLTYTTALVRSGGQGQFEPESYRLLEILHCHLERAMRLHVEFGQTRAETASLQAGLDALTISLVMTNAAGTVVFANCAARGLLAIGDGIRLARGGFVAAVNPATDVQLQAILARAAGRSGPVIASGMTILRRKGRPLVLHALPGPRAIRHGEARAAVVLLIRDPDQPIVMMAESLAALNLTPAETRLTAALIAGNSLADYAHLANLRPHTVRSTLKSALAKTGTHRQSELVLLALRVARMP